jgi:hypothetical protein
MGGERNAQVTLSKIIYIKEQIFGKLILETVLSTGVMVW